ncbi:hypothetical protein PoHVEF18_005267 [Penicillium ochrochloron]
MHDPMESDLDDLGDYSGDDETSSHPEIPATDIDPLDICVEELELSGKAASSTKAALTTWQPSPPTSPTLRIHHAPTYCISTSSTSRSLRAISEELHTAHYTLHRILNTPQEPEVVALVDAYWRLAKLHQSIAADKLAVQVTQKPNNYLGLGESTYDGPRLL